MTWVMIPPKFVIFTTIPVVFVSVYRSAARPSGSVPNELFTIVALAPALRAALAGAALAPASSTSDPATAATRAALRPLETRMSSPPSSTRPRTGAVPRRASLSGRGRRSPEAESGGWAMSRAVHSGGKAARRCACS